MNTQLNSAELRFSALQISLGKPGVPDMVRIDTDPGADDYVVLNRDIIGHSNKVAQLTEQARDAETRNKPYAAIMGDYKARIKEVIAEFLSSDASQNARERALKAIDDGRLTRDAMIFYRQAEDAEIPRGEAAS